MSSKVPGTPNIPPIDDESSDLTRDVLTPAEPEEILGAESDELLEVQSQLRKTSGSHPVSTLKPSDVDAKTEPTTGTSSVIDFFTSHPTLRAFQSAVQAPVSALVPANVRKESVPSMVEPANFVASVASTAMRFPSGVIDPKLATQAVTGVERLIETISGVETATKVGTAKDDAPVSALAPENVRKEPVPARPAPVKEADAPVSALSPANVPDVPVSSLQPVNVPKEASKATPAGGQADGPVSAIEAANVPDASVSALQPGNAPGETAKTAPTRIVAGPLMEGSANLLAGVASTAMRFPSGVIDPRLATQVVTNIQAAAESFKGEKKATAGTSKDDDGPVSALAPENVRKEPVPARPAPVKEADAPVSALSPANVPDVPVSSLQPVNVPKEASKATPTGGQADGPVSAIEAANIPDPSVSALQPGNAPGETAKTAPTRIVAGPLMEGSANLLAGVASTAMRFPSGVIDPRLATQVVTNIQAAAESFKVEKKATAVTSKDDNGPVSALAPENVPKTSPKVEQTRVNDARMPGKLQEGDVPNPALKAKEGDATSPVVKAKEGDAASPTIKAKEGDGTGSAAKAKDDAPASTLTPENVHRGSAGPQTPANRGADEKAPNTRTSVSSVMSPTQAAGLNKETAKPGGIPLVQEPKGTSAQKQTEGRTANANASARAVESAPTSLSLKNDGSPVAAQRGTLVGGTANGIEPRKSLVGLQSTDAAARLGSLKSGASSPASSAAESASGNPRLHKAAADSVKGSTHLLKGAAEVNVSGRMSGSPRSFESVGATGNVTGRPLAHDVSKSNSPAHVGGIDSTTGSARRVVDVSNGKTIVAQAADGPRRSVQVGRPDGDGGAVSTASKGFTTRPGISIAAEISAARINSTTSARSPIAGLEPSATRAPSVSPTSQSIRNGITGRIDSEVGSRVGSKTEVTSDAVAKSFGTNRNGRRGEIDHTGRRYLTGVELVLLLSLGGIRRLRHDESGIKHGDQGSKSNGQKVYELILRILESRRRPLGPNARISGDLRVLAPRAKDKHEETEPNRVAPSIAVSALIALMSVDRVRQLDVPQLDADGSIPIQRFLDHFDQAQSDRKVMAQAIRKILARMDTVSTKGKSPKLDQDDPGPTGNADGVSTSVGDVPPAVSLRRRYWTITPGDTLTGIASHVFNDSAIGWLIAKLNAEKISARQVQSKQVMEIQSRQTLSLPTPEEIHEFYKDQPPNPNNLVTVVIERAVDIELAQSSLNVVFGRTGPTFSGLPAVEISDDRQSEDT